MLFHPYFSSRDLFGYLLWGVFYISICLLAPYIFIDVENFIPSNPIVTPVHIQPEWYFLFAYAILRSIPRKIGGVVALLLSILVLYVFPFVFNRKVRNSYFYPAIKFRF
jgi:ubiquinol-cytochrome c reductase cytochrome b subunit